MKNGNGTYTDSIGNKYKGEWENNLIYGNGTYTDSLTCVASCRVESATSEFIGGVINDLGNEEIDGLAFCVGSIDLKPLKLTKKSDYMQCFNLNLIVTNDEESKTKTVNQDELLFFKNLLSVFLRFWRDQLRLASR